MARYSKITSNYILKKKHQNIAKGTIYERDWVTIGGFDRFVPGKTPYYRDGNFIFTTNNIPNSQRKRKYGEWVAEWTYDDVKDSTSTVNTVEVNQTSNDIRDFAYYGSCVELVRSSISNIINEFPASINVTDRVIYVPPTTDTGEFTTLSGYVVNNPFNIDMYHTNVVIEDDMNELRYLTYSYSDYTINGNAITSYVVSEWKGDVDCPSNDQYKNVITVTINDIIFDGYQVEDEIIFLTNSLSTIIKPKQNVIDEYFNNIEGFEKQLLIRSTTPLYKNKFLTAVEADSGTKMVYRTYIWPSNDYQIDITSGDYMTYVNNLLDMATYFDEYYTDNLYSRMTHEAIKNYDWTYTREYSDGEEDDNVDGGDRVANTIRLFGRFFDDIKRYIDGIKMANKSTYDGYNNQPDSLVSDTLELSGIESYSIIPTIDGTTMSTITLTDDFLTDRNISWYGAYSVNKVNSANMDNEFMKRMLICARRIMSTKGTKQSIEMMMGMFGFGNDDYTLTEEYRTTTPKSYDTYHDIYYSLNQNKNLVRTDEDDYYSGVPLSDIVIGNDTYIVPYYDSDKDYDGYLYFQSKGGWGSDGSDGTFEYLETYGYLGVVSNVSELMEINPNNLKNNDIYYVINLSDILDYDSSAVISDMSHMFYVTDEYNTQTYTGWTNINDGDDAIKVKAEYLENMVSININNNPHVGFGNYDNGEDYFDYMEQPFKYSIDNNYLYSSDIDIAEANTFAITTVNGSKTVLALNNTERKNLYYFNSKVFRMRNNISNQLYKDYFRDVILNYVIQVIPSTTILILENF